jgi:hypothetical protein
MPHYFFDIKDGDSRVLLCIIVALVFTIWVALQQTYLLN